MQRSTTSLLFAALLFVVMWVGFADAAQAARDPLPSWNEGATKSAIIDFVARVTDRHSKDFVPEPERRGATRCVQLLL